MPKVNISEAARMVSKSRSHLYEKYINPGVISVETDREGKKVIDTSELIRVFGNLALDDNSKDTQENSLGHVKDNEKDNVISALRAENEVLREYVRTKEQEVAWLREQVSRTTALLAHQKDDSKVARNRRWWWLW